MSERFFLWTICFSLASLTLKRVGVWNHQEGWGWEGGGFNPTYKHCSFCLVFSYHPWNIYIYEESMQEEKILSSKIVGLVVVRSLVLQAGIFNFRIFGQMRYYKFTKCHIQTIYSTKDGQVKILQNLFRITSFELKLLVMFTNIYKKTNKY